MAGKGVVVSVASSEGAGDIHRNMNRLQQEKETMLKGMRIRDEFLCPITYELFREPVVASDGHSYERLAIEKWLKSKTTSPRTGKSMDKFLTPNLNMQKLLQDMIEEGGASLYSSDSTDINRLFYVYAQKSLVMKCLGPPESKWNQQVFEVTQGGCIGGRRVPTSTGALSSKDRDRESVLFDDSTVSRIHFEVAHDSVGQHYTIRDLGSAGGTFIRIPFGKKKQLLVGALVLLGKHQFKVSSIEPVQAGDRRGGGENVTSSSSLMHRSDSKTEGGGGEDKHHEKEEAAQEDSDLVSKSSSLEAMVGDAEALLLALEELNVNGGSDDEDEAQQLKRQQTTLLQARLQRLRESASALSGSPPRPSRQQQHKLGEHKGGSSKEEEEEGEGEGERDDVVDMQLQLICFAPEGSPLIGMRYCVGREGTTLGRGKSNGISLMQEDKSIDNSVSQEHAHIDMDKESGAFFLCDGNSTKASTNGTWYRLSSPQQKSAPHELKPGMEILIGTVRFQATERMTIKEEMIEEE